MFKCQACGSTEFKLMVQPSFQGEIEISTNANDEVVIEANQKSFIADLLFMNQFALCKACEAIRSWVYYFPNQPDSSDFA